MNRAIGNIRIRGGYLVREGKLKAVHDDDIEKLIRSLGCLGEIERGEMLCHYCNKVVTLGSIACIFPLNGEVAICCSDDGCSKLFLSRGGPHV